MFEIHESRSDHSQHLLSSLISKKLQFTIFKIYACSFDPRHPNASKSTRTDLLNAAANFFSAEFPTRKREVWGKLAHDKLKQIENRESAFETSACENTVGSSHPQFMQLSKVKVDQHG